MLSQSAARCDFSCCTEVAAVCTCWCQSLRMSPDQESEHHVPVQTCDTDLHARKPRAAGDGGSSEFCTGDSNANCPPNVQKIPLRIHQNTLFQGKIHLFLLGNWAFFIGTSVDGPHSLRSKWSPKKVKAFPYRYRALGPELIPVYRQSARR